MENENNAPVNGEFVTFLEVFFSLDDAYYWLDKHLDEHPTEQWELLELRINYLGGGYRTGVSFRRLNHQLEMSL